MIALSYNNGQLQEKRTPTLCMEKTYQRLVVITDKLYQLIILYTVDSKSLKLDIPTLP